MLYAIETQGITKHFDEITAVNKVSIFVKPGELFGLLGPNGAGKTTLIHMLSTMTEPSSGSAKVWGFDVAREPGSVRQNIGVVFQDTTLDDRLTGRENLDLHGRLYGLESKTRKLRIEEVLSLVELADKADVIVKTYSGGMMRRLEIARGLMHHPHVLFLDEPTLGLDPQTRLHIWEYIKKLNKDEGVSIMLTTHYMEEAEQLCDRVAIIDYGKIVALDSPETLKNKIAGDVVKIKQKVRDIETIKKLDYVKSVQEKDGLLYLSIKDASKHIQDLLTHTGPIDFVEVRSGTLNDVFLHYTGREIRESGAEGGFWERMMKK